MKYGIEDYYDWKDRVTTIKDVVPVELHMMHEAGYARNYTNYGELIYTFRWEKGERKVEVDI